MARVTAPQINALLKAVTSMAPSAEEQITILIYALAVALKACDVDTETAQEFLTEAYNTPMKTIPLADASTDFKKGMN